MNIQEAHAKMQSIWKYSEKMQELWRIPTKSGVGDCEDFSIGVAWFLGGETRSGLIDVILKGRVQLFWAEFPNSKHMMGYSPEGNVWFDNNWGRLVTLEQIQKAWPHLKIDQKPYPGRTALWKLRTALIVGPS